MEVHDESTSKWQAISQHLLGTKITKDHQKYEHTNDHAIKQQVATTTNMATTTHEKNENFKNESILNCS